MNINVFLGRIMFVFKKLDKTDGDGLLEDLLQEAGLMSAIGRWMCRRPGVLSLSVDITDRGRGEK